MKRLHEFNRLTLEQDDLNVILRELLVQVAGLMQAELKAAFNCARVRKGCFAWLPRLGLTAILSTVSNSSRQAALRFAPPLDRRQRVLVEDLTADTNFVRFAEIAEPYGIRGAQSTLCSTGQARSSLC